MVHRRHVNCVSRIGPSRLPARYWRLRWASDLVERVRELEVHAVHEVHEYDDECDDDRPWRRDLLDEALRTTVLHLHAAGFVSRLDLPRGHALAVERTPSRIENVRVGVEARLLAHLRTLLDARAEPAGQEPGSERELALLAQQLGSVDPTALAGLLLFRPFWLRPLERWSGGSLAALVEYLLVAYPVPRFLLKAWQVPLDVESLRFRAWSLVLAQGGSLVRLSELGEAGDPQLWARVPSRLAHALARVPDSLSVRHGVMLAEILRLGGSEREFELLRRDPSYVLDFGGPLEPDELAFWRGTVAWLIRRRDEVEHERDASLALLAWARHEQTERARRGQSFEWRGRTWASARRDALAYQQSVRHPWLRHLVWRRHGWDLEIEHEGAAWTIHELCSSAALREESQAMAHCVHGYDLACWRGDAAIFSLSRDGRRCTTIELRPRDRCVVQVKRAHNQAPSPLELEVIAGWVAHLRAG